jgi:hypothetical protein
MKTIEGIPDLFLQKSVPTPPMLNWLIAYSEDEGNAYTSMGKISIGPPSLLHRSLRHRIAERCCRTEEGGEVYLQATRLGKE